jgi:hypothetical protein
MWSRFSVSGTNPDDQGIQGKGWQSFYVLFSIETSFLGAAVSVHTFSTEKLLGLRSVRAEP